MVRRIGGRGGGESWAASLLWVGMVECCLVVGVAGFVKGEPVSESGDVVELDELFVHDVVLGACISAILFEDRGQVPALEFAQTADNGAGAMGSASTHDHERVDGGVEDELEGVGDGLFGDCIERGGVLDAEVVEVDRVEQQELLELEAGGVWGEPEEGVEAEALDEVEAQLGGLAGPEERALDESEVGGRDELEGGLAEPGGEMGQRVEEALLLLGVFCWSGLWGWCLWVLLCLGWGWCWLGE